MKQLVLLLLMAAPAWAAPVEEAQARFSRGVRLYETGDFAAALGEFEAAYKLAPRYQMLFNIGVTERRLFRYDDAVRALRRYLDEGGAQIAPERRQQVEAELAEIRALVAEVTVKLDGPAELELDGRSIVPRDGPLYLAAGAHKLRAMREGCDPAERAFTVVSGEKLEVALAPKPRPKLPTTAHLSIATRPPGAELTIDGKFAGKEPWSGTLSPGGHEVVATLAGHEKARQEAMLVAGQERALTVELRALPKAVPVYKKWWLWTIVGVVAAGAVAGGVGGYFATRPKADLLYPPQ